MNTQQDTISSQMNRHTRPAQKSRRNGKPFSHEEQTARAAITRAKRTGYRYDWEEAAAHMETCPDFFRKELFKPFFIHIPAGHIRVVATLHALELVKEMFEKASVNKRRFLSLRLLYLADQRETRNDIRIDIVDFLKEHAQKSLGTNLSQLVSLERQLARDAAPAKRKVKRKGSAKRAHKHLTAEQVDANKKRTKERKQVRKRKRNKR